MSEIRRDRLHSQYVLIAPERMRRPDTLATTHASATVKTCPFCDGNEKMTPPEIYALRENKANERNWKVRVVPNLYKAVQVELEDHSKLAGMFESIPGVGAHEIVIDTPCHECRMVDLDAGQIKDWLSTIALRIADLRKDGRLVHISIFKNQGEHAGATQQHPHTQIIALPITPSNELNLLERHKQYYRRHGRSKVEDILENERLTEARIISERGDFTAYCPYASAFPFEVIIAPRRALTNLDELNRDDMVNLANLMKSVFVRLDSQLGDFDFNLTFRLAPVNSNFENAPYFPHLKDFFRFTIRIIPRIYRLGGFELSTGMIINPVAPEEAAKLLREVKMR
ncbi:UTP--glucose-1-phosphate uridylyltransferase [Sulfurovum sp.]|uniref:galactose-1-phosphate uridylyltransferase n=1 Tax=Sulfurovum sp. TaxID=1969726 RepID=UPI0025D0915F|nr:UTP--glucose-1-phosphate uridylyltransferase [Sulfurovum sp.]